MIRSLISIAMLFAAILLIGKVVRQTLAEEGENNPIATVAGNDVDSSDIPEASVKSGKLSKKKISPKTMVKPAGATKPVPTSVVPSLQSSLEIDCRTLLKEDSAGTDDTSKKEGSEAEAKPKEQEMPNPADVPKQGETSDDKTDLLPPGVNVRRSQPLRETPLKVALPEPAKPVIADPTPVSEKADLTQAESAQTSPPKKDAAESDPPANDTSSKTTDVTLQPIDKTNPPKLTNPHSLAPLTPEAEFLRGRVRHCLQVYFHEPINNVEYSPWGIMHALIAFGVDSEIYAGDRKVNAIGWLCYNGAGRGMQMMYVENGKLRVRQGPGYQGHAGQFLAMLAQSRVKKDFPIKVDGKQFTVADLIEMEKDTCRTKTELTFKLIALSHYLDLDATWKNDLGEEWDIPRLIREELAQPIVGAACGGTHRMTGFSYAVNKRIRSGEALDGQWLRAKKFVDAYHDYIYRLQNPDGSFSTKWFAGREDFGELDRRLQTTGHMLEWLVCSLPDDQLDDPRLVRTIHYLVNIMEEGARNHKKWEVGPRGHAIHALSIYDERRFGDKAGRRDEVLAKGASNTISTAPKNWRNR